MAEADLGVFTRVNGASMGIHQGRRVALVCEVVSGSDRTIVKASDGQQVQVQTNPGSALPTSKFAEVVGIVDASNLIREEKTTVLGDDFDLGVYNRAVSLMQGEMGKLFQPATA